MEAEETIEFAKMIEDKIDILHVSGGMRAVASKVQYMMQPMYLPHMFNVWLAERFRRELSIPITAVGSVMSLENAEMILSEGLADFVAMARPFLADPELVRKSALGHEDEICPCIRCNYHGRVTKGKGIACAVNPLCGRESQFPQGVKPARVKKHVVVVGGGPAGMQAARTAVERGHRVTLYERAGRLGGNMLCAAAPEFKEDVRNYLNWAVRQTECSGAEILLNTELSAGMLEKEKPDALIIAVGAEPFVPRVPGIELPHVAWAPMVDMGLCEAGRNVVILGAGVVGYETAVDLSKKGHRVTIIELQPNAAGLLEAGAACYTLMEMAENYHIVTRFNMLLREVRPHSVLCRDLATGMDTELPCDSFLLASGLRSRRRTVEDLRHVIPETEVFIVGDARQPRSIAEAVAQGFGAAEEI